MLGVEVFTSESPHQLGVHRQGFASRPADRRILPPIAEIDPNPAETITCTFAQLDVCFSKAGAGEQGGQGDDGQRGSIGEAVAL